jgi:hypothetical protein
MNSDNETIVSDVMPITSFNYLTHTLNSLTFYSVLGDSMG